MLTKSKPHSIVLAPGSSGYFGINKNLCTLHANETARYVAAFPPAYLIPLANPLEDCSAKDPSGHVVDISPFEKTIRAVLAG